MGRWDYWFLMLGNLRTVYGFAPDWSELSFFRLCLFEPSLLVLNMKHAEDRGMKKLALLVERESLKLQLIELVSTIHDSDED